MACMRATNSRPTELQTENYKRISNFWLTMFLLESTEIKSGGR